MNWENKEDDHQTNLNHKPLVDERSLVKQEGIIETYAYHSDILSVSGWKCRSCGNKVSGPYAPCPVCNAQNSYIPIH